MLAEFSLPKKKNIHFFFLVSKQSREGLETARVKWKKIGFHVYTFSTECLTAWAIQTEYYEGKYKQTIALRHAKSAMTQRAFLIDGAEAKVNPRQPRCAGARARNGAPTRTGAEVNMAAHGKAGVTRA